jgi:O-antigen/teichoic acid export membrane protein
MAGPPLRRQAVVVSAALMAGNASSYLFTIVAARLLVPEVFGELGALMALLVVGVVPAMAAQTGIALHVAGAGSARAALRGSVGLGLVLGAAVSLLALAAAPALTNLLHLSSLRPALVLPLALLPFPLTGAVCGVLQGRQRFGALAFLLIIDTVGRAVGGLTGLVVGRTPAAGLAGIAIGVTVAGLVGWLMCGRPLPGRPSRDLTRRVSYAIYATVGLVVLLNLDMILARHVLTGQLSGAYAVGVIVSKIAYWLPQAVAVIVLPRLADPRGRRRTVRLALVAIVIVDAPVVLAGWLAADRLLPLIGGLRYSGESIPLGLFAFTGCLLAVAQILLMSRIAAGDLRSIALVWLAIGIEVVLVMSWLDGSVGQVAAAAAAAAGFAALAGVAVESRRGRTDPILQLDTAGDRHGGGGRTRAESDQHGGLGDRLVRPSLTMSGEASAESDRRGHRRPAHHDPGEQPGPQLPHQRTGEEQHDAERAGQRGDEQGDARGDRIAVRRPGDEPGGRGAPAAHRQQREQHDQ